MTQPAGSIARGITAEQCFYLRASPILCVADALAVVVQFIQLSIRIRSLPSALGYISRTKRQAPSSVETNLDAGTTRDVEMTLERGALPIAEPASEKDTTSDAETLPTANITAHLETAPNTGMIVYQLKSLHENDMFRRILFIFGVLPQFLKLYTCAGIPGFQVLASMYLIPWVVLELLVVVPARYSVAESPALVNPDLAYINHLDDMVIWMCYFAVHYSDYATIPYLNVYLLPDKTSQIPGHKLLNEVVYIWKSSASMLLSYFRLWFPFFYAVLLENMTYIPLVVCLARPGVPTAMWIICLRAGRFLSMHGVRVRTAGRHMTTPSFKHQPRTASIAFFLMQVVGAVGLFCILYDPKGTSKPSWALFLV